MPSLEVVGCALLAVLGVGAVVGGFVLVSIDRRAAPEAAPAPPSPVPVGPPAPPRASAGHENTVVALAFSPDGTRLASGSLDQTLRVWDVATGAVRAVARHPAGPVWAVGWTADGLVVTTSGAARGSVGGRLTWTDPDTGMAKKTVVDGRSSLTRGMAVSPDGTRLAWIHGQDLEVIPTAGAEGSVSGGINAHDTTHMAFTRDGRTLLLASRVAARDWDLFPAAPMRPFRTPVEDATGVGQAGDWHYAVASTKYGLAVVDRSTGKRVEPTLDLPTSGAFGVAPLPDGKVATGVANGVRVYDPATRREVGRVAAPEGVAFRATAVAASRDGTKLAAGGGGDAKGFTVYVWEASALRPTEPGR